jgi:hypothetical protein
MGRNARDYYEYYFSDDEGMSRIFEVMKQSCDWNDLDGDDPLATTGASSGKAGQ